jgi:hypothetical protein
MACWNPTLRVLDRNGSPSYLLIGLFRGGRVMVNRYGFKLQMSVSTFQNYFPHLTPTARDLANILAQRHANGTLPSISYGTQSVSIADVALSGNSLSVLFHLYDPLIQDQDYHDPTNGNIRLAQRRAGEEPARSAHLVLDISAKNDQARDYPTGLENVEFLSRSLIQRYLNDLMEQTESRQEVWTSSKGNQEQKKYSPRIKFAAHFSQSIDAMLGQGGVLIGVKAASTTLRQTGFGDAAYPVVEEEDMVMKIQNRPSGNPAKSILKRIWREYSQRSMKKVTVIIEDSAEQRLKSVNVDVSRGNILDNIFVRQFNLGSFTPQLRLCEPRLRNDLVTAMTRRLL